jgi:hypothetical protein
MRRKIVVAAVTAFWLVMMGWLARREMSLTAEEEFYRELAYSGLSDETVLMDVFWRSRRAGEIRTSRTVTEIGMSIRTVAELSLGSAAGGDVSFSSHARLNRRFRIEHLLVKAVWGKRHISAMGSAEGNNLLLKIRGLGPDEESFTIPNAGGLTLASGLLPTLPTRQLREGSEWEVPAFDLAAGKITRGRARVESMQKLLWNGKLRDCYRITFMDPVGRRTLTAWADRKGTLVKAEVMGATLVRRPDAD